MPSQLALYLAAEIEARGWDAAGLAARAGIPKGSLHYTMNQPGAVPELATLSKLAKALDVPLDRLIRAAGFDLTKDAERERHTRLADIVQASPTVKAVLELLVQQPPEVLREFERYILWRIELDRNPDERTNNQPNGGAQAAK